MLYAVVGSGNSKEGPSGDDTFLIVRADSRDQAVELAESELIHYPRYHEFSHTAYSVIELHDVPKTTGAETYKVLGPLYGLNAFFGEGRFFHRNDPNDAWVESINRPGVDV